ncbi:MAG: flavodoxin family protein [Elusimicrobiaceae bacterium]|nr:flavodoxin family protein [Elusimicrobiaceae bacterium]
MSKKVLIISASPRKGGNSDVLCDQFLLGAKEAGHEVEKVFLRDKKINYCMGCGVCNNTHTCVQKDDMKDLLEKMVKADVLVLATPVYFYTMDGQLKTFIDRCVSRYTEMTNKEVYFIVSAADTEKANLKPTIEGLRGFTRDCLEGTKEKGIIYGTGAWQVGEIKNLPVYQEAYETGKKC